MIVHAVLKKVNWSNIVIKWAIYPRRSFEFFSVSKSVNKFVMFLYLKSVCWLSSVSWIEDAWLIVSFVLYLKSVYWLFDVVVQWNLKILIYFFLFCFLKIVNWLSSMSYTQRVLTDFLNCVVLEGMYLKEVHWIIDTIVQWNLKGVYRFCLVWYLKSGYWLSMLYYTSWR